ncbi:4'-phosphopantetheinyl transferase family protein [Streptomyces sp. NPDC014773]|uniref:4'-phosphopantetheinyl transferase family protein n=1 Tax=Streptomyces sp. NPDC014773 TaxID=3364908 RepID=UPI0036F883CA
MLRAAPLTLEGALGAVRPELGTGPGGRLPGTGGARAWTVDVPAQRGYAARLAPGLLDAAERTRAGRFVRADDRDRYVTAHVALRLVLGAVTGTPPARVAVDRAPCAGCGGPHGRPVLRDGRRHFSLSHGGSRAVIVCAPVPVGVDVERIPRGEVVGHVAPKLHPAERAELAALAPAERPVAFARAWTRKEALLKALGTGLVRSAAADYVGSGPFPSAADPAFRLFDLDAGGGHAAALALLTGRGAAAS